MRSLFFTVVFTLFTAIAFGQEVSRQVQWRLDPILNSVKVTEAEKRELITAIEKFQEKELEIRSSDNPDNKEEKNKNARCYLAEVEDILGEKRFNKWRNDLRKGNNSSNNTEAAKNRGNKAYPIHVDDMPARDPYVYVDEKSKHYYMHLNDRLKIGLYKSPDLENWVRVGTTFEAPTDFWGTRDFWAPDTYYYNGKYYVFASFSNPETKMKGTSALVSEKLEGPYKPLVNQPITPADWRCLDGYLYVDDDSRPWLLFCRAFHSVPDGAGRIYAQKLSSDLKTTIGDPILLFKASEAPWAGTITFNGVRGYVTDSPFIYRANNGELLMLWSSFAKSPSRYVIGVARSSNGRLDGEWIQDEKPLNSEITGGGHAMIFTDLEGKLRIAYHAPNKNARPKFYWLEDINGKLKIKMKKSLVSGKNISQNEEEPFR
jgi:hypothetical protein